MRVLTGLGAVHPDQMPFDVAERKGIGHPDSLADLVADSFSRRYSKLCREQFGVVPNHWVDKVNLVGAAADVRFGGYDIHKPIDGYLFGKLTEHLGGTRLPLADLFGEVTRSVLVEVLDDEIVLDHLRLHVNNTAGTAVDHDKQFYQPRTAAAAREVLADESVANDTVLCAGSGPRGAAAETAAWLESLLTRRNFRSRFGTGTDVKVMVVRSGAELDVTAAVPFLPGAVSTWTEYRDRLDAVQDEVGNEVKQFLDGLSLPLGEARLHLNTKDVPGRGYLAPFGTSLGKGDCGAVAGGTATTVSSSRCGRPAARHPPARIPCTMPGRSTRRSPVTSLVDCSRSWASTPMWWSPPVMAVGWMSLRMC